MKRENPTVLVWVPYNFTPRVPGLVQQKGQTLFGQAVRNRSRKKVRQRKDVFLAEKTQHSAVQSRPFDLLVFPVWSIFSHGPNRLTLKRLWDILEKTPAELARRGRWSRAGLGSGPLAAERALPGPRNGSFVG